MKITSVFSFLSHKGKETSPFIRFKVGTRVSNHGQIGAFGRRKMLEEISYAVFPQGIILAILCLCPERHLRRGPVWVLRPPFSVVFPVPV